LLTGRILWLLLGSHLSLPHFLLEGVDLTLTHPRELNLGVIKLLLGLQLRLNLMILPGGLMGYMIYRRYFRGSNRRGRRRSAAAGVSRTGPR